MENELSQVKWQKPGVWSAFLKYSELSDSDAVDALTTCGMPMLDVDTMPGANGMFRGKSNPDTIFLAKAVCDRFEKDYAKAKAKLLVESTILHEMVHWGDWKDGVDQAGEEGKLFEIAAYGHDVNRYW